MTKTKELFARLALTSAAVALLSGASRYCPHVIEHAASTHKFAALVFACILATLAVAVALALLWVAVAPSPKIHGRGRK